MSYTVYVSESNSGRIELADDEELTAYRDDPSQFFDSIKWTHCSTTTESVFDNTNQREIPLG